MKRELPIVAAVDTQWFKDRMADQFMSLRGLAGKLDMDPSSVSLTINGKRKLTAAEATQMAELLRVPVEELMARAGLGTRAAIESVGVVGWLDAAGKIHERGVVGPGRVLAPAGSGEDTAAIRCQEGLLNGWLFFHRKATEGVSVEALGRLCLVMAEGLDGPGLRWLNRGYEAGKWLLGNFCGGGAQEVSRILMATPVTWIRPS